MTIRERIEAKLDYLSLTKQEHQINVISEVVNHFLNGTTYIFLLAPTGSGKSIIAYIVSEVLADVIFADDQYEHLRTSLVSNILIHNNTLLKQYQGMFSQYMHSALGADNYHCSALNSSARYCIKDYIYQNNPELVENCEQCEYRQSRDAMNDSRHLITNYQYFFISKLFADTLKRRLLTIYDECHEINDIFSNVYSIDVSQPRINSVYEEITEEAHRSGSKNILNAEDRISKVDVENNDYYQNVRLLNEAYAFAFKHYKQISNALLQSNNFSSFTSNKKIENKYDNFKCKTADFLKFDYQHTLDYKEEGGYIIKPIFLSNMFRLIKNSPFHLFMSATLTSDYLTRTINFERDADIKFIQMKSTFKRERKQLRFINSHKLNYKQTNNPDVIGQVSNLCHSIIVEHNKENGIIQAPSFNLTQQIASQLNEMLSKSAIQIFEHKRGQDLNKIIAKFKRSSNPSILISPNLFVGVDLPGNESTYQIMIKAPFPSLGDARMQYIIQNHPAVYQTNTLFKILQGLGRSNRSEDDYSITYCIDTNIEKIFRKAPREIQNQFSIKSQ
jgi:Rad3-related DNA helicase